LLDIWQSYGGKVDCLKQPVVHSVLVKDEDLAWDLTYDGQELLQQHHVKINTPY